MYVTCSTVYLSYKRLNSPKIYLYADSQNDPTGLNKFGNALVITVAMLLIISTIYFSNNKADD